MQKAAQSLLRDRQALGRRLGFGGGLAMGPAAVGRIGSEGRLKYTAVGNVVNLAARAMPKSSSMWLQLMLSMGACFSLNSMSAP